MDETKQKTKTRKILSKILSVILLLALCFSSYKVIKVSYYKKVVNKRIVDSYNDFEENHKLNSISYDKYISLDGDIDSKLIDEVNINISLLPEVLTYYFFTENNGKIIITDKDISTTYYKGEVKGNITGLYNGKNKVIYLEADKSAINSSLIHEFGHVLDDLTGWTTVTNKDFNKIYLEEKDKLKTPSLDEHHKLNEREFLAQSFGEYILEGDRLKSNTPKIYDYIDSLTNILDSKFHENCCVTS